jgi:copper homeostasis protein
VAALKSQLSIPIYVMARPHAESFYYSDADFEAMKHTMTAFKDQGADGFVFGILNQSSQYASGEMVPQIDVSRNKELVELAEGRPCTFHRAFDLIPESQWDAALTDIVKCGFRSILTSGGPSGTTAMECVNQLANLVERVERLGKRMGRDAALPQIIVGGGVRAANIELLREKTHAPAFHSAALTQSKELVSDVEVKALRDSLDKKSELAG